MTKSLHKPANDAFLLALIAQRKSCGMTQTALAERIGKPQSFIAKIEIGERRLDVIEFVEICHALGIWPDVILDPLIAAHYPLSD